jgi:hypothetical protein
MSVGKLLSAEPNHLENVCPSSVRRHLQLFMKPGKLVSSLDGLQYWR